MKVVINTCFGGFSLSPLAVKRIAELQGRPCYFFTQENYTGPRVACTPESIARRSFSWSAFDIPNPEEVLVNTDSWHKMSMDERVEANKIHASHEHPQRPEDRADLYLVQAVEELGDNASGSCAKLEVVEIPDGVQWEIDEYDGNECVAETHRTWR